MGELDLKLLRDLAVQRPGVSFVLVGPTRISEDDPVLRELSGLPNVYRLGLKPVEALPSYIQHMDVCMLPYVRNDYTRYIYPMKLHEYLATGLPVVGTPITALQDFGDVVALVTDREEWLAALDQALRPEARSAEASHLRQAVAREHDWALHAESIAKLVCRRLGPDYVERMTQLTI